jgi:hypothetical protein
VSKTRFTVAPSLARSDLAVTYQGPHSVNFQAGGAEAVVAQRASDIIHSR